MRKQLISIIIFVLSASLFAQQQTLVTLERADRGSHDANIDKEAQFLAGNIRFRHGGVVMECDSAVQKAKSNAFDAFGNVHIIQGDTLHIYGDKLYYDGVNRIARLRSNVKMVNQETTLTTDFFDYNMVAKIGYYFNFGTLTDLNNKLESLRGYYFTESRDAYFKDSVKVTTKDYIIYSDTLKYNTLSEDVTILGPTRIVNDSSLLYSEDGIYQTKIGFAQLNKNSYMKSGTKRMWGDTIIYDQTKGEAHAYNYVKLEDQEQGLAITGQKGIYNDLTQYSQITDSAVLQMYEKIDTLFLHADTLIFEPDTANPTGKIMKAYNNVRFFRFDIQGKCDSLSYSLTDSVIQMYNDPVLWALFNQLSGDEIKIYSINNNIDHIELNNNGFIASMEDTSLFNQVKGKMVTGYIRNNKLNHIFVDGNAETIYFPKDKTKIIGCNKAMSSYLTIFMHNNMVDKVVMKPTVTGTFSPLKKLTRENTRLKGFEWRSDIRPISRNDIFRREPSK